MTSVSAARKKITIKHLHWLDSFFKLNGNLLSHKTWQVNNLSRSFTNRERFEMMRTSWNNTGASARRGRRRDVHVRSGPTGMNSKTSGLCFRMVTTRLGLFTLAPTPCAARRELSEEKTKVTVR